QRLVDPLLLEDDADAGAKRTLALRRVVSEDADLAGVRRAVALEDLDERRLAGPVRPEDGEHLAAADVEVDAVERLRDAVVGLAQAAHADRRGAVAGLG